MSPDAHLDAAGITSRQFATVRRGFDPGEVRAYLHQLSEAVGRVNQATAELQARARQAESRAEQAERLDETRLVELLGEETTRVLAGARAAAADIRQKAQESASRLISEANDQAHQVRAEAETAVANQRTEMMADVDALRREASEELDRRRAEADELVAQMRRDVEADCDALRRDGDQARVNAVGEAEAIRSHAQEEGRQLVAEAQVVRERMLRDLSRRRRAAREQLERLNAARDRLLAAYEVVRRTVAEATTELRVALPEAKIAGDQAMRRVHSEPEPTIDELEGQVAMARVAGLLEPLEVTPELYDQALEAVDLAEDAVESGSDLLELAAEPDLEKVDEVDEVDEVEPPAIVAAEPDDDDADDAVDADEVDVEAEEEDSEVDDEDDYVDEDDEADIAEEPASEPVASADPGSDLDELFARLRSGQDAGLVGDGSLAVLPEVVEAHRDQVGTEDSDGVTLVEAVALADADDGPELEGATGNGISPGAHDEEVWLRQRDEALEAVERDLTRRLKRALADEQNEVLDLLRRAKPTTVEELFPTVAVHATRYADAAREELSAAAAWGAIHVADTDPETEGTCDALAAELGQMVVEPLRERVGRSFGETGGDLGEVTDRLRALYREWKGQRIADAVRHYTAAAYAQGAYDAVPARTPLCWVVDRGGDPCPDADDNALAGAVFKGEGFPTGDHCPPAHVGCRCLVVPFPD